MVVPFTLTVAPIKPSPAWGIPIVFFDRVPRNFPVHAVRCNVEEGARAAVEHLLKKGNRKIALLNGPASLEISQERLKGFQAALAAAGYPISPRFEKFTDLSSEGIAQKMEQLFHIPDFPEAILAFNDYIALEAMLWCKKYLKPTSREVNFASFANQPITHFLDNPPAVSVEQFAYQMGEQAVRVLLNVLQKPEAVTAEFQAIMLETELMVH